MVIVVYIAAAIAALAVLAFLLLGRGPGIARGRYSRMARIGRLSARLWTSWLGAKLRHLFTSKERRAVYNEKRRRADAEAVAQTMGDMKGVFMKFGQMMSFINDSVAPEYRAALQSLQAQAPPMAFSLIRDVAEHALGKPLERAFAHFETEPLAAASIGQVHRARLPTGEEVVVKVQYPGVADAIKSDLANVGVLYRAVGIFYPGLDPKPVIAELRSRIFEELDYRSEANNQAAFAELYRDHPFIRVPEVFPSHSTGVVLTSEYIAGRRFEEVLKDSPEERSHIGEILYRFIFGSIRNFGVFNGDPHPGNYLFDDAGRVAFLDFGCIKYFPEPMMRMWEALVRAHFDGERGEFKRLVYRLRFAQESAVLPQDLLYDYFGYFYEPFRSDRVFKFTSEYNRKSVAMMLKPDGEFAGIEKKLNMPADFVLVNRIQWGVYSILSQLGAVGNWHRIHREYLYGDEPSTELGRIELDYRARWRLEHGLAADSELFMTPEGVRERVSA